jgi:uncharacterized protein YecT (DUF1311 family)
VLALALVVAAALPPIHEAFTPLPCPHTRVSTLDMEGCLERDILRTDRVIDARRRRVLALLNDDGRRAFVRAERAWLTYRRAACEAAASRFAGGTFAGVSLAACYADQNRRHASELAATARGLKQP